MDEQDAAHKYLESQLKYKEAQLEHKKAQFEYYQFQARSAIETYQHQKGDIASGAELPSDAPVKSFTKSESNNLVGPHWKLSYEPAANEIVIKTSSDISGDAYLAITNVFNERWPKKSSN